jgi:transcriptional regulator with XRE-family HTH domain
MWDRASTIRYMVLRPRWDEQALARRLQRERADRGWSLARLSQEMGLDAPLAPTSLQRIERGERPVRVEELFAFARAFGAESDPLDLLQPPEVVDDRHAHALIQEIVTQVEQLMYAGERIQDGVRALIYPEPGELSESARARSAELFGAALREVVPRSGDPAFVLWAQEAVRDLIDLGYEEAVERSGVEDSAEALRLWREWTLLVLEGMTHDEYLGYLDQIIERDDGTISVYREDDDGEH